MKTAYRASVSASDIALRQDPLISRHLQFPWVTIHPYFVHATRTLMRGYGGPPSATAQRNHKAWWTAFIVSRSSFSMDPINLPKLFSYFCGGLLRFFPEERKHYNGIIFKFSNFPGKLCRMVWNSKFHQKDFHYLFMRAKYLKKIYWWWGFIITHVTIFPIPRILWVYMDSSYATVFTLYYQFFVNTVVLFSFSWSPIQVVTTLSID